MTAREKRAELLGRFLEVTMTFSENADKFWYANPRRFLAMLCVIASILGIIAEEMILTNSSEALRRQSSVESRR
jgi:hypothetical protein